MSSIWTGSEVDRRHRFVTWLKSGRDGCHKGLTVGPCTGGGPRLWAENSDGASYVRGCLQLSEDTHATVRAMAGGMMSLTDYAETSSLDISILWEKLSHVLAERQR